MRQVDYELPRQHPHLGVQKLEEPEFFLTQPRSCLMVDHLLLYTEAQGMAGVPGMLPFIPLTLRQYFYFFLNYCHEHQEQ